MSKFLIIDPSVKGTGGHYYEYALRVLRAARDQGHVPLLVAHRDAPRMGEPGFSVLRHFHFSFFENSEWLGTDELRAREELEKQELRAAQSERRNAQRFARKNMSRSGLDRARAAEIQSTSDPSFALMSSGWAEYRSSPRRLLAGLAMRRISALATRINGRLNRSSLLNGISSRTSRALTTFGRLATIGFKVGSALALAPVGPLREAISPSNRQRIFESDLLASLRQARAKAGDVVFVPTLGEVELAGIVALCQRAPLARTLRWRLLFRRDIFSNSMASRTREADQPELRRMRSLLSFARNALRDIDVEFFTDTTQLSAQYTSLGIFPFRTAPIPVDERFARTQKRRVANDPIVFTYLGDARTEKGYASLPGAVDQIAHDLILPRRVKVIAQSNFNTKRGEQECIKAHLALMTWPQEMVARIYGPLNTNEYVELMRGADAVLIPYSPANYSARSSGVFAEALRAGVPSVVTGGSWMAGILEPYRQTHLAAVFPRLAGSRREFLRAEQIEGDRMLGELIEVPVGRSTMIAAEIHCAPNPDYFLRLDYDLVSASGATLGRLSEHVGLIDNHLRALTMIPSDVRWIRAHSSVPGSIASIVPEMIMLSLVNIEHPVAVGMGGVICDGSPTALALAMRNISYNFETYAADARRLAAEVGSGFTPERLVEMLAGPAPAGGASTQPPVRVVAGQRRDAQVTIRTKAARETLNEGGGI
jgi:glycosyltransferase involved in cell wall biosynthesis